MSQLVPGYGLIPWVIYAAAAILFVYFIAGLVVAGARQRGGDQDASAPIWPLVAAMVLGASGAIGSAIG